MLSCRSNNPRLPLAEIQAKVIPKASRNHIEWDGNLRIYVTAPPAKGEANKAVISLLAKKLKTAKSNLSIIRGDTSQVKTIAIESLTLPEIEERLNQP